MSFQQIFSHPVRKTHNLDSALLRAEAFKHAIDIKHWNILQRKFVHNWFLDRNFEKFLKLSCLGTG